MIEKKRYSEQNLENHLNRIYDNQQCKVIFDEDIVGLLNDQEEIQELKQRNRRQYNQLKEITDLMSKRDWNALEVMVKDWEATEELLQAEWRVCGDVE